MSVSRILAGAGGLESRSTALAEAVNVGGRNLDVDAVRAARRTTQKVGERSALGTGFTVVALAGATGSGKSSLFNALVGADLSQPGFKRPTTSHTTAATWGPADASALLDWLDVRSRHMITAESGPRDGLVLLDLPDFDSREASHREEADRILQLADVFVWVTDPQKYADAVIHDDYIRVLSARDTRTLVVLNQSDRLSAGEIESATGDLRRLLERDGIRNSVVITTSATTGYGIEELGAAIAWVSQSKAAAEARLLSDVRAAATNLRRGVADGEVRLDESADAQLVDALAGAAGVPVVVGAVERDYIRQANIRAGWPLTSWLRRLGRDPLKSLGLGSSSDGESGGVEDVRTALGRSSIPQPTPAQRSAVDLATRALADRAADGLPLPWAQSIEQVAVPDQSGLADSLDQAVMSTSLKMRRPIWWNVVAAIQWLFAGIAVIGLVWLLLSAVLGFVQVDLSAPKVGPIGLPGFMLMGGLICGLITTALMKIAARRGARARRDRVRRSMSAAISEAASSYVMEPVRKILDAHRQTRELLDRAAL